MAEYIRPNPPDLQPFVDAAREALQVRHGEWASAARQDAVESMRRLSRWHLVRRGCRVPLYELYFTSMKRTAEKAARDFVAAAAPGMARWAEQPEAELVLRAKGCILPIDVPRAQTDRIILQTLLEPPLEFIQRFEREVAEHIEHLHEAHLRPHLDETIDRIQSSWAEHLRA